MGVEKKHDGHSKWPGVATLGPVCGVLINPFPHILAAGDEQACAQFWLQHGAS